MTRRLPASGPPAGEGPPPPEPVSPAPEGPERGRPGPLGPGTPLDDLDGLDGVDATDALDEDLLDPDAFPDDPEDPVLADALAEDTSTDLDALPSLEAEPEEDIELSLEDDPLEGDLVDLEAPDDVEMPILPWSTTVRVDGRPLPAVVDPGRARTIWLTPACPGPSTTVALELAGRTLRLTVDCSAEDSEPERVVLGRDVLAGRFLLRP